VPILKSDEISKSKNNQNLNNPSMRLSKNALTRAKLTKGQHSVEKTS
jgi:hypothetical protein